MIGKVVVAFSWASPGLPECFASIGVTVESDFTHNFHLGHSPGLSASIGGRCWDVG